VSDFFWGGFVQRWRKELALPDDANPYYHYDLDWIVTVPNMDPWIRLFQTLRETPEEVVVKTGFGQSCARCFTADARVHRLGDRYAGEAGSGQV